VPAKAVERDVCRTEEQSLPIRSGPAVADEQQRCLGIDLVPQTGIPLNHALNG
jgi:hypothetical protein